MTLPSSPFLRTLPSSALYAPVSINKSEVSRSIPTVVTYLTWSFNSTFDGDAVQ